MITSKKPACLVAVSILCIALLAVGSVAYAAEPEVNSSGPYHEVYTKLADTYIGAKSLKGEWASSTTIEGSTLQEQWDNKIAYLEEVYGKNKERFIVEEGIPFSEIEDMSGPAYLYKNSSLYRDLAAGGSVTVATGGTFSKLTEPEHTPTCERYVFYADKPTTLTLNASYQFAEGTLALWVVSSTGEVLHHNDATASYNQTIKLNLDEGLHSIVLEYHMDNGHASGTKTISGTLQ